MWTWVLSGTCHLGKMVPSRVPEVSVGGRDLKGDSFGRGLAGGMMPMITAWISRGSDQVHVGMVLSGICHLGHMAK